MTNSHNNYYPMVIILLPMVNILLPMVIILLPTCMVNILLPMIILLQMACHITYSTIKEFFSPPQNGSNRIYSSAILVSNLKGFLIPLQTNPGK